MEEIKYAPLEAFGNNVLVKQEEIEKAEGLMKLTKEGLNEEKFKKGVVVSSSSNLYNSDIDVFIKEGDIVYYVGITTTINGLDVVHLKDIVAIEYTEEHKKQKEELDNIFFVEDDSDEESCDCSCKC
jgi:hypothetical protein